MSQPDADAVVSVEQDGRILSGVGVSAEDLQATMERHAPPESEPPAAPPVDPAAPPVEGDQPQTRGRKRFADLTFQAREAERKAIAAEERAKLLEQERDELKTRYEQRQPEPQRAQAAPPQEQPQAQGFQFPTYEQAIEQNPNLSYDDWRRAELFAFAEWKDKTTDIDARIRQSIEADRASRSFLDTVERTRAKGREVYKDFDAVLTNGPGAQIPLGATLESAQARAQYVISHAQSEHLQYAILKDGDLARSLQRMSDMDFGMKIAQIAPNGSSAQSPASLAVSGSATPPAPFTPVGSGSSTTVLPSAELAKKGGFDYDRSGYREKRAAERGLNRRPR